MFQENVFNPKPEELKKMEGNGVFLFGGDGNLGEYSRYGILNIRDLHLSINGLFNSNFALENKVINSFKFYIDFYNIIDNSLSKKANLLLELEIKDENNNIEFLFHKVNFHGLTIKMKESKLDFNDTSLNKKNFSFSNRPDLISHKFQESLIIPSKFLLHNNKFSIMDCWEGIVSEDENIAGEILINPGAVNSCSNLSNNGLMGEIEKLAEEI